MMLAIEYVNMCTRGAAQHAICGGRWRQYLIATGLGATPGCLGAFASVSLYVHGLLSLGALVGCMIATSGDEAFVLLAMNPKMGLFLMGLLFVVGLGAAWLTDRLYPNAKWERKRACQELVVHEQAACGLSSWRQIVGYWKQCSAHRGILAIGLLLFIGAVALGEVGPKQWNWIRVTLLAVESLHRLCGCDRLRIISWRSICGSTWPRNTRRASLPGPSSRCWLPILPAAMWASSSGSNRTRSRYCSSRACSGSFLNQVRTCCS